MPPFGYSEVTEAEVALLDPSPAERVRFRIDTMDQAWTDQVDAVLREEGFKTTSREIQGGMDADAIDTVWMHPEGDEIWVRYYFDYEAITVIYPEGISDSPTYL